MRAYQKDNQSRFPDYWNRPVAGSGPFSALTIVGLAPGLHGANKTGIPFTGDASGILLFKVLGQLGIVDQVRITNAVKCAPPQNKPLTSERRNCRKFLNEELSDIGARSGPAVLFCLGRIAHEEVLRSQDLNLKDYPFGHGHVHQLSDALWLVDSYHCSRYNIQTNRLTESMFRTAVQCAAKLAQLNYADI
ncbi:MAG: uracil-DNA glycosylase family 4 [Candidatus Azotimanducaceae bacterium]|jgi:uracil-DNA glycosylase family 4